MGRGRLGHTIPYSPRWMNISIQFNVMAFKSSQEQSRMLLFSLMVSAPSSARGWVLPKGWLHPRTVCAHSEPMFTQAGPGLVLSIPS